jgi:hypothetical protein
LQYKTEAIPGKPLKRKVTQEETRERKKQYEKDREHKFIDSWKQDRPWLHHNVEQMLWSATGALKPMDQKSYIYIYIYTFVILNSGF